MAYQGISTGTGPNTGSGDSLLDGAVKINNNFTEIYNALGDGTNINFDSITSGIQTGIAVTYDDAANKINFSNYTITTTSTGKTLANLEYCTAVSDGISLVLPASPSVGNKVMIGVGGNFSNVKIERNGSNIMGIGEDMTIDNPYVTLTLIYINSALGWRIS